MLALITLIAGLVAASALIAARRPDARSWIEPLAGWIGIALFLWGIWGLLGAVRSAAAISTLPSGWALGLAESIANTVVGFLLGVGLFSTYPHGSSQTARIKGEHLRLQLAPYQGISGLFAIAMGAVSLVLH